MSDLLFSIRPYRPVEDDAGLAALLAACNPNPWTVDDIEEWRRTFPAGGIESDLVATDESGAMIGHANTFRFPWAPPGHFSINVSVHPGVRRRGLGKRLFEEARQFAVGHGAILLKAIVQEDEPSGLPFAQSLGFSVERHEFESRIDVETWEDAAFAGRVSEVEGQGVRFFTFADEPCEEALYELAERNYVDLPGFDPSTKYPPIGEWRKRWLEDPDSPLDCIILAAVGEQLVGVTRMGKYNGQVQRRRRHENMAHVGCP